MADDNLISCLEPVVKGSPHVEGLSVYSHGIDANELSANKGWFIPITISSTMIFSPTNLSSNDWPITV